MSLKSLRAEHGYTQEVVAKHLNISRAAYTNIENGKRQMDSDTIIQLADFYGISTDEILDRAEIKNQPTVKDDELKEALVSFLVDLTPSELQRVRDFVAGIKANRREDAAPQE